MTLKIDIGNTKFCQKINLNKNNYLGDASLKSHYLYKNLPVKSKMAFLSRILILLAILLNEQYIHHTQGRICPKMQFLSAQYYAYQSLLSYFLV